MKINVKVDVKGFDVVKEKIDKAIINSLKIFSLSVERDARIFAPRDTGLLKSRIRSYQDGFKATITAETNYAEAMERPGRVRKEGQRPYMKPALDMNVPIFVTQLKNELDRSLN